MKERPILFSTPMVQAILDGRKSQTRRIVKIPDLIKEPDRYYYLGNSNDLDIPRKAIPYDERVYHAWRLNNNNMPMWVEHCPYGKVGDRLWVRETWTKTMVRDEEGWFFVYKADGDDWAAPWKPSIFMPKEASRIKLEITNIRVERVQDISEDDAIAEGIQTLCDPKISKTGSGERFYNENDYPTDHYESLWESINGKGSWDLNPWVWVISFRRINALGNSETPLKEQQLFMDILNDERDENS
jgi:hypothetical protein